MEIKETYLWEHYPFLSSVPTKRIKHSLKEIKKDGIDETAVFQLENGLFLFIRFYGTKENLNLGYTDIKEFDNLEEAVKMYEEYQ